MTNQTTIVVSEDGTVTTVTHGKFIVTLSGGSVTVTPVACDEEPDAPYVCAPNPQWPQSASDVLRFSFAAGVGDESVGFRNDQHQQYGQIVSGEPDYAALQASRNPSGFLGLNFKPTFASNYIDPQARVFGPAGEDITGGWVNLQNTADGYYMSVASPAMIADAVYCVEFRGVPGAE